MLHSALPRAYLATPGMGYLGGYFGAEDAQHPYNPYVQHQLSETYAARLSEQRVLAWDTSLGEQHQQLQQTRRASTPPPCPLDLSLKPPPTPSTPSARTDECEAIEVDDEEDRRSREEARSHHSSESRYPFGPPDVAEEDVVVDDLDSQRSCSSVHSNYHPHQAGYNERPLQPKKIEPVLMGGLTHQEAESLRVVQEMTAGYPEAQQLHGHQKLLFASPTHLQNYHLQLLQTPQHHHQQQQQQQQQQHHPQFQGIHAPMTPPSTPSPPQCPRRKNRDEDASSPGSSSVPLTPTATPKQSSLDKPRVKKKHARKLKFDEDTSSPVSGTVILGPDEAVVTGDIDPAFNIVEVTEEARAELAKIENRLGPYQCKLCGHVHDDAFQLAQHRCSRIANVEYRCPECDKRFSCPANLASHRRWHKPRPTTTTSTTTAKGIAAGGEAGSNGSASSGVELSCTRCEAKFSRPAALRKHMSSQHPNEQNNNNQGEGTSPIEGSKQQQIGSATVDIEMA